MPAYGLEHLTANLYVAYPFKENAPGLAYAGGYEHGLNATVPLDFLVDAAITVPQGHDALYLYSISKMENGQSRFRFSNQAGTVVFLYDLSVPAFTSMYQVIDMVSVVSRIHVRLLVSATFVQYLSEIPIGSIDTFNARLPFDPYVLTYVSNRVQQFELGIHTPTGKVKFQNGYNTKITRLDPDTDGVNVIQIDVAQGLGKGLYPCVDTGRTNPAMGLIPSTNGNVTIAGDPCTGIVPHKSTGQIEIQSDCTQCCTCSDYVNAGLVVKNLVDRADMVRKNLLAFHTLLTTAVTEYNTNIAKESEIVMSVFGALGMGGAKNICNLAVSVANRSEKHTLQITDIHIHAPGAVQATNFTPTTLDSLAGVSFYFVCKSEDPHNNWDVEVRVNYTYEGVEKVLTKLVTIT